MILAAVFLGLGVALWVTPRARRVAVARAGPSGSADVSAGWLHRYRLALALLCGAASGVFVGGSLAWPAGVVGVIAAWVGIGRSEPVGVRKEREAVRRDLPHVVTLLAAALRSGSAPGSAITLVAAALPGPAAERLSPIAARLSLGGAPAEAWESLAADPELAPLGRAMSRAQVTGASVVTSIERLADDLTGAARAAVEDKARAVGVRAALPLGLCLLPAFLLTGVLPLVVGLLRGIAW